MDGIRREGHKKKDTTVSRTQLEVREMVKTAQQMESSEENSVVLKRGDDSKMHQREEENQKTSVEEINAEQIILLKEENGQLIMKCEDFKRKIQELEKEKKDSEDFERELQVQKEDENMKMTAEYEKKVQDLEKANQKLSQKKLIYKEKIRQMEEQKTVLDTTSEHQKTINQLLKEKIKKMEENEEHVTKKLDLLELQNTMLKKICKRLLKKSKKRKSPCSSFRNGRRKEEKQAKESKVEVKSDKGKEKKGALMKWIHGLFLRRRLSRGPKSRQGHSGKRSKLVLLTGTQKEDRGSPPGLQRTQESGSARHRSSRLHGTSNVPGRQKTEAVLLDCRERGSQVLHFTAPADGVEHLNVQGNNQGNRQDNATEHSSPIGRRSLLK
ncbi:myosin heavy chain, embryonic smooth muscle isoform-like isoform X2 [Takifugu flavidus]|uniref:myosin heavy chain, embryonic smooth muscle isoform-like isoform X2 n=1 Tax=Takifugu flavidus TaxID=433684 RepID=UPI0025443AE4|nr:myosin heavy chain, embryonic smooth muscle isoform-like isoform X2 [Takifugu flavidus]